MRPLTSKKAVRNPLTYFFILFLVCLKRFQHCGFPRPLFQHTVPLFCFCINADHERNDGLSTQIVVLQEGGDSHGRSPPPYCVIKLIQFQNRSYRFLSIRKRPWLGRFLYDGMHPRRCCYRFSIRDCIFFVSFESII